MSAVLLGSIVVQRSSTKSLARASNVARKVQFSYAVTIKDIPPGTRRVDVWMPVPRSDSRQNISNLQVECDYPHSFETEPEYGNSLLKVEVKGGVSEKLSVAMSFSVARTGYHLLEGKEEESERVSGKTLERFLAPDRLVPIDGTIRDEAGKVVREDMTALEKARAIYNYVARTLTYDKSGTGWGRGDALYACDVRRGNCTDFHSLFVGMARASGVPARFVIGFSIPEGTAAGEIPGYHCWAEFHIDGLGWLPVDVSEASRQPDKLEYFFGGLDANRVQFTVGRDIGIESMGQSAVLNYFIYPYVLVDGKPHDEVEGHFRFSKLVN